MVLSHGDVAIKRGCPDEDILVSGSHLHLGIRVVPVAADWWDCNDVRTQFLKFSLTLSECNYLSWRGKRAWLSGHEWCHN